MESTNVGTQQQIDEPLVPTVDQLCTLLDGLKDARDNFPHDSDVVTVELTLEDLEQLEACTLITLGRYNG